MWELTNALQQFKLKGAIPLCTDFLQDRMDESTCLGILVLAKTYGLVQLGQAADEYVLAHFKHISAEESPGRGGVRAGISDSRASSPPHLVSFRLRTAANGETFDDESLDQKVTTIMGIVARAMPTEVAATGLSPTVWPAQLNS
ncbi:hypothetical protein CRENBAI_016081 [Crenichthys baileyi]|uniref:Uncharacterized protein n=1 Tax=Crenichthys baileyi TaxID=28760 RepID=A0AAV9RAA9_9TELE